MNKASQLTEEERTILYQMLGTARWDLLLGDLTILLTTMMIAGYGIWKSDAIISTIGVGLYIILRLRASLYQERTMKAFKSEIRKLLETYQKCEQADTSNSVKEKGRNDACAIETKQS